jgi:hypothetical protein
MHPGETADHDDSGPPAQKKPKITAGGEAAASAASAATVSLRVACMDGASLAVTVSQQGLVSDVTTTAAQWRNVNPSLVEVFIDGAENALPSAARLDSVGVGDGSVLFMLQKQGA